MSTDSKDTTFPTSTSNASGSGLSSGTSGLSSGGGKSSSTSGMSSGAGASSLGGSGSSLGGSSLSGGSGSTGSSGGYSSGSSSSGSSSLGSSSGGSLSGGSSMSGSGADSTVHRVAQAAHQAVDKLEQTLGSSGDRVMSMQQEYGEMATDYVKGKPLQSIGMAFAAGVVFSKLFLR